MSSTWVSEQQKGVALLERRKGLLGRNRVGALTGTYVLVGIAVALTAILFAAVANLGSTQSPTPHLSTVAQGSQAVQVLHADPLQLAQVTASLSVPGRVALNHPASQGVALADGGAPLGAEGALNAGDSIQVCTDLPAPSVELTLADGATGTVLDRHTFVAAPLCGP